ncbi:MAG: hypothetical protein IKP68_08180 [Clostridia bacterium]|nr:hypothetical protein [Clostridia bacterium]
MEGNLGNLFLRQKTAMVFGFDGVGRPRPVRRRENIRKHSQKPKGNRLTGYQKNGLSECFSTRHPKTQASNEKGDDSIVLISKTPWKQ